MALTGNFIASGGSSAMINYDLFCSVFGMLTLFYLLPASIKESLAFHPIIPLVLNILNTIFWFVGGVATAAYLNVHSCNNSVCTHLSVMIHASRVSNCLPRTTTTATTPLAAPRRSAARRKPLPPSSGSASPPSSPPPSSLASRPAVAPTPAQEVSAVARP